MSNYNITGSKFCCQVIKILTVASSLLAGILELVLLRLECCKEDGFVTSICDSFIIWSIVKGDSLSFATNKSSNKNI